MIAGVRGFLEKRDMFRQVSDHRPLTHVEQGAWDYSRRQFLGHAGISLAAAAVATLGADPLRGSEFAEKDRVGYGNLGNVSIIMFVAGFLFVTVGSTVEFSLTGATSFDDYTRGGGFILFYIGSWGMAWAWRCCSSPPSGPTVSPVAKVLSGSSSRSRP